MNVWEIVLLLYVAAVWFLAREAREAPPEPHFAEQNYDTLMMIESPPLWTTRTEPVSANTDLRLR